MVQREKLVFKTGRWGGICVWLPTSSHSSLAIDFRLEYAGTCASFYVFPNLCGEERSLYAFIQEYIWRDDSNYVNL